MVSPPNPRKTREKTAAPMRIKKTMLVTEHGAVEDLAELVFKTPGPTFAVAKISVQEYLEGTFKKELQDADDA